MLTLNHGHRKLLTVVDSSRVRRCVSGQSVRLSGGVLSLKWDFHVDPTTTTTTKVQGSSWKRGKKNVKAGGCEGFLLNTAWLSQSWTRSSCVYRHKTCRRSSQTKIPIYEMAIDDLQTLPLTEEALAVDRCWRRENRCFWVWGHWRISCVSKNALHLCM